MNLGFGGSSSSSHAKSAQTSTTPWTAIANQLAGTLKTNLADLGSGKSIKDTVSAITESTKRGTKEGIANIKEAFGASGLRFSSDLMHNLADFQTGQQTSLNKGIASATQIGMSQQLQALQSIIALGAGSGTTTGTSDVHGSQFGWDLALQLLKPAS